MKVEIYKLNLLKSSLINHKMNQIIYKAKHQKKDNN